MHRHRMMRLVAWLQSQSRTKGGKLGAEPKALEALTRSPGVIGFLRLSWRALETGPHPESVRPAKGRSQKNFQGFSGGGGLQFKIFLCSTAECMGRVPRHFSQHTMPPTCTGGHLYYSDLTLTHVTLTLLLKKNRINQKNASKAPINLCLRKWTPHPCITTWLASKVVKTPWFSFSPFLGMGGAKF